MTPAVAQAEPPPPLGPPGAPSPFDIGAYETALDAKLEQRPDLARLHHGWLAANGVVFIVGLVLLVRAWRRRAAEPRPGPPAAARWGAPEVLALVLVYFLLGTAAIVLVGRLGLAGDVVRGMIVPSQLASLGAVLAAFGIAAARGQGPRALGFGRAAPGAGSAAAIGLRHFVMGFPLYYGVHQLVQVLARHGWIERKLNRAAEVMLTSASPGELALAALVAIAVAPVLEEVIFRGFLYGALRPRLGRTGATFLSSLAFAAVHPATDVPAIFFVGVFLALAYERAGSIGAPIAMHAVFNGWGVATLAITRWLAGA